MAVSVLIDSIDRSALVDIEGHSIEEQASRLNPLLNFRLRDEARVTGDTPVALRERMEVEVYDGAALIFGGEIASLAEELDGLSIEYHVIAQGFTSLLRQRVIEDWTGAPALPCYDDDLVDWIVSHGTVDLGLSTATYVSRTRTQAFTEYPDLLGRNMHDALVELAQHCPAPVFWVGHDKEVHWTTKASAQLVSNGDFESAADDWTIADATSSTWQNDLGPGGTGDGCLRTIGDGTGTELVSQTITGIVSARRYVLSADVWADAADSALVSVEWLQAGDTPISTTTALDNGASTSAWVTVTDVLTAPALAAKAVIRLAVPDASLAEARFDNVSLIGETAPFGVSTTPDGTTTQRMLDWFRPSDAPSPVNRVLIRGTGISGWRENAASIAYYGRKFEGVIEDERVTTEDGIDSRAAWAFAKWAFPGYSGRFVTTEPGIHPGDWVIVEVEQLGLLSIEWVAAVKTTFTGDGNAEYTVTYGKVEEDSAAVMAQQQMAALAGEPAPGGGAPPPDTNAPAVPDNVTLDSETLDGQPYLIGSWDAVADVDLDAYELELDRALDAPVSFVASASGTGGSLPAGTYAVQVTGEGLVSGETGLYEPVTGTINDPQEVVVAAGERLYVTIEPLPGVTTYRIYASILAGGETQPKDTGQTTTTTESAVEVTAAGAGANAVPESTALSFLTPVSLRLGGTSLTTFDVIGGAFYGLRVRALDLSGNVSAWSATATAEAGADSVAPGVPTNVAATAGFRLIGVRWDASDARDLASYEVRYAAHDELVDNGTFDTDTTGWFIGDATSTERVEGIGPDGSAAIRTIGDGVGEERMSTGVGESGSQTINVVAGQRYRFSVDLYNVSPMSGVGGGARLIWFDDVTNIKTEANLLSTAADTWETLTAEYTAPAGATRVRIDLLIPTNSTGTTYWDNVSLTPLGWQSFRAGGTVAVIQDLTPDTLYYAQVRALDRSGNVRTSFADSTPVRAADNPEAGWSNDGTDQPYETATPTAVGAADVAFNSVVTQLLDAGTIDADNITAGTLTVGGTAGATEYVIVKDASAVELLRIDEHGLVGIDPDTPTNAMRWWRGRLEFTSAYNSADPNSSPWTAALSADGLVADVIRLGSAPGGHNMVSNSGFELAPFAQPNTVVWTDATDWQGHLTGDVNLDDSGAALTMGAWT